MDTNQVNLATGAGSNPTPGSAGVNTQLPGMATTVSSIAGSTGGIGAGNLVENHIDNELFKFETQSTVLMAMMLKAKTEQVDSPIVEHYMFDEQRTTYRTESAVAKANTEQFVLPLGPDDRAIPQPYHTLLVKGVSGYDKTGQNVMPGQDLMLFVKTKDNATGNPIVTCVNGPRQTAEASFCTTPAIPAGSKVVLLANAMYETQKEVNPDSIVPQAQTLYLQKRGMNSVFSDYFDRQNKRVPWKKAQIAEQQIKNFKNQGNRSLWVGQGGMMYVSTDKVGNQAVYFTTGVRWQFRKILQHRGPWTFEQLLALCKMYYTGEDKPKNATMLVGKNLLESLQCIDLTNHPEIKVTPFTHPTLGWEVKKITTAFGDLPFVYEPTLDTLGYANSGAILCDDRLKHYVYAQEKKDTERIDGEEAERSSVIVWDGLGLKGSCHIWIDGEGESQPGGANVENFVMWDATTAPADADLVTNQVYYLMHDVPAINAAAKSGTFWQHNGTSWSQYSGNIAFNS